jgi:hypothetical protein
MVVLTRLVSMTFESDGRFKDLQGQWTPIVVGLIRSGGVCSELQGAAIKFSN